MGKFLQIENKIFTEERLILWGWGAIITFGFLMGWKVFVSLPSMGETWPILPNGYPRCIDFGFFWLSGKLAVAGDTSRIFDFPAWSAIQASFFNPGSCPNFNRFFYPPTLLFLTYPLGLMPYVVALGAWIVASFGLYQAAVYAIIPRRAALIVAATPVFVMLSNVLMGHNGFFSAALIGLALLFYGTSPDALRDFSRDAHLQAALWVAVSDWPFSFSQLACYWQCSLVDRSSRDISLDGFRI